MAAYICNGQIVGVHKATSKSKTTGKDITWTRVYVVYDGNCSGGGSCAGSLFGTEGKTYNVGDSIRIIDTGKGGLQEVI